MNEKSTVMNIMSLDVGVSPKQQTNIQVNKQNKAKTKNHLILIRLQ
jgi:hypothetical protein